MFRDWSGYYLSEFLISLFKGPLKIAEGYCLQLAGPVGAEP
jgi:hypothetical protein